MPGTSFQDSGTKPANFVSLLKAPRSNFSARASDAHCTLRLRTCDCRPQHRLRTHVVGWVAVWETTVPRVHRRVVSNQQQQQLARWVVRASHTRLEAMVACGTIPITVRAVEYLGWHAWRGQKHAPPPNTSATNQRKAGADRNGACPLASGPVLQPLGDASLAACWLHHLAAVSHRCVSARLPCEHQHQHQRQHQRQFQYQLQSPG